MAWATSAEITTRVGNLTSDTGRVESKWDTLITQKTTDARQEITAILLGKGLIASQIDLWASQRDVHLDLASWMVIHEMYAVLGAESVDFARFEYLNRLKLIQDPLYVPADSSGVPVEGTTFDDVQDPVFAFDRGEDAVADDEFEFDRPEDIVL